MPDDIKIETQTQPAQDVEKKLEQNPFYSTNEMSHLKRAKAKEKKKQSWLKACSFEQTA